MTFFSWLGVATFLFAVGWVVRACYEVFVYRCDLTQFQTKAKDAWAMVTGCTGGIGEAFAFELARRGFNVLLVSRSEAKLKELAAAIKAKYPKTQVDYVASDATSTDAKDIQSVVDKAATKRGLTILINNVGVSNNPSLFDQTAAKEIEDMIVVNCRYSSILTHKIVPLLKKQPRAAIVNLSSQSAFYHVPYLAVYSATKAYNYAFSNALREELKADNIDVLALTPGTLLRGLSASGIALC